MSVSDDRLEKLQKRFNELNRAEKRAALFRAGETYAEVKRTRGRDSDALTAAEVAFGFAEQLNTAERGSGRVGRPRKIKI